MSVECFIGTREEHLLSRGIFHLEADKSSCAEAKISGGTLPSHGAERPKEAEGIFFFAGNKFTMENLSFFYNFLFFSVSFQFAFNLCVITFNKLND